MKIESVNVTVFQYPTRRVSDSAGHSHPGPESMAKMAMLTITADDGTKGYSFAPPEVVRPLWSTPSFARCWSGKTRSTANASGKIWRTGSAAARIN
jgi:hypothetical protein